MKSTVVDESLSTTTTRVYRRENLINLLQETTEWEIYTKERLRFPSTFGVEWTWPQILGSLCWAAHPFWRCDEPNSWSHSGRICTLWALASGCVPWSYRIQCAGIVSVHPLSLKRLLHHPSRLSSMSGSVALGSSALISEMWLGYYTAWTAYIHIWKILGFPWWKQCIALMPHPLQFAKNLPPGPSRRSNLLQLGFQWLLVPGEADRVFLSFWHSAYKIQCKSADLSLSCTLIQLHYTMGFDWGK